MLKITHNYGFFSCCSVRLYSIIDYFNKEKKLPIQVDCSEQFQIYKKTADSDVVFDFFENYNDRLIEIKYDKYFYIDMNCFQFDNYKDVDYTKITPFIQKYFSPSSEIIELYNYFIAKYNINVNNCISLYYRGTDKCHEIKLGSFEEYSDKLDEIANLNPNMQILIQTDSSQFLDYMKNRKKNNVIVINELSTSYTKNGVHYENTYSKNYQEMKYLMASFLIISRCKHIICNSGNCSIWIMFYRGNSINVHQYRNDHFL
jgi:hypothetical protein